LELLLPVGYTVYLNDDLDRIIYDIDNVTNTRDGKMLGRRWIMTPKGLACVDCDGITDKEPEDIDDLLEHELEKKQERLELEQERLEREMEKHQEELERIEEELEREVEPSDAFEEASFDSEEILLKRVINASYKLNSTTFRNTTVSYPG
jgi:DNA repair exonuclease SbcCD ATPase subunit